MSTFSSPPSTRASHRSGAPRAAAVKEGGNEGGRHLYRKKATEPLARSLALAQCTVVLLSTAVAHIHHHHGYTSASGRLQFRPFRVRASVLPEALSNSVLAQEQSTTDGDSNGSCKSVDLDHCARSAVCYIKPQQRRGEKVDMKRWCRQRP